MSTSASSQNIQNTRIPSSKMVLPRIVRLAILIAMDASAIWFLSQLISLGYYPLAAAVLIIVVVVNIVLLRQKAYPLRWMIVGLVLIIAGIAGRAIRPVQVTIRSETTVI